MTEPLSMKGSIVAIVVWLGLVVVLASQTQCIKINTCYSGDFILNSIVSAGLMVPAWFVGTLLPNDKRK